MTEVFIKTILFSGLLCNLACSVGGGIDSDPFEDLPEASVENYRYSNKIRPSLY